VSKREDEDGWVG